MPLMWSCKWMANILACKEELLWKYLKQDININRSCWWWRGENVAWTYLRGFGLEIQMEGFFGPGRYHTCHRVSWVGRGLESPMHLVDKRSALTLWVCRGHILGWRTRWQGFLGQGDTGIGHSTGTMGWEELNRLYFIVCWGHMLEHSETLSGSVIGHAALIIFGGSL